MVVTKTVSQRK